MTLNGLNRLSLFAAVLSLLSSAATPLPLAAEETRASNRSAAPTSAAAEVGGRVISMADLEQRSAPSYATLDLQLLSVKHQQVRAIVREMLLAQEAERRGVALARLLEQVGDPAGFTASAEEIQDFYDENADRFPQGVDGDRDEIVRAVRQQKAGERVEKFADELERSARIVVYLPPKPERVRAIRPGSLEPAPPPPPAGPVGPPGVIAEVNGARVPVSALDAKLPNFASVVERQRHKVRVLTLGKMIDEVLVEQEAARRGISRDALYEAETAASTIPVSDQVELAYQRMKRQGEPGRPQATPQDGEKRPIQDEESVKRDLTKRIREAKVKPKWDKFVVGLRAKATITVYLKDPDGKPATLDTH